MGGTLFSVASRGPALMVIGTQLWLAYTAVDNTVKYLTFGDVGNNRTPVAGPISTVPGAWSACAPAMCITDGRGSFIAWTDQNNHPTIFSMDGTGFIYNTGPAKTDNTMTLTNQSCIDGPSLAYISDRMYLAWADANQNINIIREDKWQADDAADIRTLPSTTPAPCITAARQVDRSLILNIAFVAAGTYEVSLLVEPQ